MRKKALIMISLVTIIVCSGCSMVAMSIPSGDYVLIDPGHGGFDGGTVADNGVLEKDINLSISLFLSDMLRVSGITTVMTRATDVSTQSLDSGSIHDKKVSDLQNRLKMYESAKLVISIHQNHFDVAKYSGTQVFYSANNPESSQLAKSIQQSVVSNLQPNNTRQTKIATNGVYLMHHTTVPAVLVECGFLSNPEELQLLQTENYRQQIAWSIMLGYWQYILEM